MNRNLFTVILPLLILSGCLDSAAESDSLWEDDVKPVLSFESIWGHQFNGTYPSSIGNITEINITNPSLVVLDTWTRYHQPESWERGFANITIQGPDNFTWTWESQDTTHFVHQVDIPIAGDYVIRFQTSGADNQTDEYPGDAMIVYTEIFTWN